MRTARLALAAAGVAALAVALPSGAATPAPSSKPTVLTIADPTGDAQGGQAATDVTSVVYTTKGTTKKVGKKDVYTPTDLVVTMSLAAPPTAAPVVLYEADSKIAEDCTLFLYYLPGDDFRVITASGVQTSCGGEDDGTLGLEAVPVVTGSTITWTVPLADLAPALKGAHALSGFHSYVGLADPVIGVYGPEYAGFSQADADVADSDQTFTW